MTDTIWTVKAEFLDRDDAVALMDLIREMGYKAELNQRTVNNDDSSMEKKIKSCMGWWSTKLLIAGMTTGRSYSLEDLGALLEPHGFSGNTAATVAAVLTHSGQFLRLGPGLYRLNASPVPAKTED